jgi:predicted amidohydrolase
MPPPRAIAVAQTTPVRGEVNANLTQHLRLARIAAEAGARVLVYPELSLTGYELDLAADLAFSERDPRLAPLVDEAATNSLILIVGAPVRIESRLHIGAFILYPDGSIDLHTKRHLGSAFSPEVSPNGVVPPAEDTVFDPGTLSPLVRFDGHVAAVAICAESLQRSVPREAAERGADTYLTGHFSVPQDVELRLAAFRAFAARHRLALAFATCGGPSGGLAGSGKSAIVSPSGDLLVQLERAGAGVAVAREDGTRWQVEAIAVEHA